MTALERLDAAHVRGLVLQDKGYGFGWLASGEIWSNPDHSRTRHDVTPIRADGRYASALDAALALAEVAEAVWHKIAHRCPNCKGLGREETDPGVWWICGRCTGSGLISESWAIDDPERCPSLYGTQQCVRDAGHPEPDDEDEKWGDDHHDACGHRWTNDRSNP